MSRFTASIALFCLFGAVFLVPASFATTIEGNVYTIDSLFPVSGVVLKASGETTIQKVLENGNYSIELPPGRYEISAYKYEGNSVKYYFRESITVDGEKMEYDLVLFPPDEFEEALVFVSYEMEDVPAAPAEEPLTGGDVLEEEYPVEPPVDDASMQVIAGILLLLFFFLGFVLYFRIFNKKAEEAISGMEQVKPDPIFRKEMDAEEKRVLEILKKSEGMSTQKELREIMKCTDTKMSLLVSSLEARGLVKRIKRGREKIVKIDGAKT